jgi:transketolase
VECGRDREAEWQRLFDAYAAQHPELAERWRTVMAGELPAGWDADIPSFKPEDGPMATRVASGKALNALAGHLPTLMGGAADLAPSTNTLLRDSGDFEADNYGGRNMRFGVREHAMGAVVNGMALHGGVIPYGATFLIFSDYMRPPIRLAALTGIHVVFVFTHDSIGLGEDGPTHQPVEQLTGLRAIPNLTVVRPADANETAEAWRVAIQAKGPVALVLTRQNLPVFDRTTLASARGLARGGYILAEAPDGRRAEVILIATGSEVALALAAREELAARGTAARVVSMPSCELFEQQPQSYKDDVLPPDIAARLAIEAGAPHGWWRYVGSSGDVIGLQRFGASAPGKTVLEKLGFNVDNVVARARALLERRPAGVEEEVG